MNQQLTSSIIKWLVAILVLVVVLGGGYILYGKCSRKSSTTGSTATNKTADWRTYTDSKYGYSVKYPLEFKITVNYDASDEPNRLSWIDFDNSTKYGHAGIAIEVRKNIYKNISDWADEMNSSEFAYDRANTTLGNITAISLTTGGEGGAIRTGVIKGDKLYVIHLIGTDASWTTLKNVAELKEIYKNMLASFQFAK